jgi:phosphatidylglycerol:prolipoprotein diacylglycerol transferase
VAQRRAAVEAKRRKARSTTPSRATATASAARAGSTSARSGGQPAPATPVVEAEALVVSSWFDSGEEGNPFSATVRVTGRRVGINGLPGPRDTFSQDDRIDDIVPGSGPVSVTTWVNGLEPGEWTVNAELVGRPSEVTSDAGRDRWRRGRPEPIQPAAWSWRRWGLSNGPATPVKTRWAPLAPMARIPAVLPGSFTALAVLGVVVALVTQAAFVGRANISVGGSLAASLLAIVFGLVGAKLWYAALHPGPWRQLLGGWSVDGFLVAAPVAAVVALLAFGLPSGGFLDASAPGIFFAVAIGRIGCFFTGCCAGRCTRARWGVWSSDRRIGARRVPTQLLESATGLLLGAASTALVLAGVPGVDGAVFVAALAVYVVIRQVLLRLRAESRLFSWRRSDAVAQGQAA